MTVEVLLEQMDDLLDKAWSFPLSGGKCVVDAEAMRNIIDDIRGNMPSEVRQAKAIVSDRSDIVDTAKQEAEGIITRAEDRARRLIEKEEIVVLAQQKAKEILVQAQQKSREMRKGATDFSESVLKKAEDSLAVHLTEVRQARVLIRNPASRNTEIEVESIE